MISTPAYIDHSGILQLHHRDRFAEALKAMPNTPGEIIFEPHKNGISHNQRKYFYGVVVDILHAFFLSNGNDCSKDDVVDFLKDRFMFREKLSPITGRYIKTPISLSAKEGAMTKQEFDKAKEDIQRFAAESLSLEIPEPDPNWKMHKKDDK